MFLFVALSVCTSKLPWVFCVRAVQVYYTHTHTPIPRSSLPLCNVGDLNTVIFDDTNKTTTFTSTYIYIYIFIYAGWFRLPYRGLVVPSRSLLSLGRFHFIFSTQYHVFNLTSVLSPPFRCVYVCVHGVCGGRVCVRGRLVSVPAKLRLREFHGHSCF